MIKKIFDMSGKTVLITGAAGLLGRYHAETIIESGGDVLLTDCATNKVKKLAYFLNKKYETQQTKPYYMDVTNLDSIQAVCQSVDKIDVLINNAAKDPKVTNDNENTFVQNNRFETMSYDYWREGLDVSLNGTFLVTQAVVNKMINSSTKRCDNGGIILNIASDLGVIAPDQRIYKNPEETFHDQNVKPIFYSAAKWSIIGMTKYLSTYLAPYNIRVNSLSPGGVFFDQSRDFVDKVSKLIPLARMANADEYKGTVLFACSNASSYMTGHNLIVDGGRSVW